MKKNNKRKINWKEITWWILLVSLVFSVIFSITQIIISPSKPTGAEHEKLKTDYMLMLIQCTLGLVVMFIPSIIERKWSIYNIILFSYIITEHRRITTIRIREGT